MTEKHIHRLPVVDEKKRIVGVISIDDAVKKFTAENTFIIDQLVHPVH